MGQIKMFKETGVCLVPDCNFLANLQPGKDDQMQSDDPPGL